MRAWLSCGAIPQAHQPAAAEAVVVARLLQRLGGDRGQARIARVGQRLVQLELPGIDQPLPHDGAGRNPRSAARPECHVDELRRIAQEGERILVAAAALELPGVAEQQPRLPDQIEREVGERPDPPRAPARGRSTRPGAARAPGSCPRGAARSARAPRRRAREWRRSQVLHLVGNGVEGRVAVHLVARRLEQRIGLLRIGGDDLAPSARPRCSRPPGGACRHRARARWPCAHRPRARCRRACARGPARERMNTSNSGQSSLMCQPRTCGWA